ncbi:SusC/RagA family TonB-linked outer membrane protein [Xanthomarina gelatinilytica]|uniref:SusC/RagA family TonB-linked outer membrane protein n=1 Tax=Xanthomarina gelatinilytica TaxID=1137281 RepID=UPI003AA81109
MKTKFSGILTLFLAFVVQFTFAQEKTISGTVSDENGLPLPGVNIIVKGTTNGTQTDFDGNYSITASTGDVLSYSFVGYTKKEMTVGASNNISFSMTPDVTAIDEVVITAFGIKKEEKAIGYAVQSVKGDDIAESNETNVVNSLSGKVAGVQVTNSSGATGSSSRIVLRGASSITGNNQPLFVIDGIPVDNSNYGTAGDGGGFDLPNGAADINPDDIESVTVLKGPNAAALYGLRAANGVIVITTKKGSTSKDKLGITFSSSASFENPLLLPDFQNSYGQGGNPFYFEFIDGQNGDGGIDESWGPALDVGYEFVQWNSYTVDGAPLPWVSQPDNVKDFYETGLTLNNNISFTGGTDKTNFRLSLGLLDQEGMVPNTDFRRYNISGVTSMKVSDKINVSLNAKYIRSEADNLVTVGYSNANPVQQMIWSGRNVDFNALKDWQNLPLAAEGTASEGTPLNWNTVFQNNPFWYLDNNLNAYNKDRIIGGVNLSFDVTNWLTVSGKTGVDFWKSQTRENKAIGSNDAPEGYYRVIDRTFYEVNSEILLTSAGNITDDLTYSLNAGGNTMYRKNDLIYATAPQLELPGLYNVSNVKTGVDPVQGATYAEQKINSLFGFGQLAFKNMLFVDVTARNDWSSLLPVDNNSFFYPSVTVSAVLSDVFNMDKSTVSLLKVRGGWSKVGSTGALGAYRLQDTYSFATNGWDGTNFLLYPSTINNPEIGPETTSGYELGLDARLFENRLRFDLTYYDQTSEDLIVDVQLSSATGSGAVLQNVGEMRNKGWEVQLGGTLVRTDDWQVDLELNWAKNENEVVSLGDLETLVLGGQWSTTVEARVGESYGTIVGPAFERAPNGEILYENGLPVIGGSEVLGNVTPDWTGGVNLIVSYKNFRFDALVDGKMGGDIYSMTTSWGRYAGVLDETMEGRETGVVGQGTMNIGTEDNPEYVPNNVIVSAENYNKAAFSNSIAESSVFDASYIKLRQLGLTYTFPKKWLANIALDDVNFSVVGRNLAFLYKKVPHIDPESAFSNSNGEQGQEFGQLPSARSISFNVNLKF